MAAHLIADAEDTQASRTHSVRAMRVGAIFSFRSGRLSELAGDWERPVDPRECGAAVVEQGAQAMADSIPY